jgi:hypothetical protein
MAQQLPFMSLRQTSSGHEITAVQPGMPTHTVVKRHRNHGLGDGGIQKSTIKQYNADNTIPLHHSRRMKRNVLLSWLTFQSQAESESVSRRFLIRLMIKTKDGTD